ncbi:unnamed protein product [Blepharisma stoltei]|uniref:MYND-type domain-containing protein n=1 Tax=Blepharisma stoltei TaxID=1481888 RepID=A0AAU9JTV7_9CILI|nr:unnamed protein product [Blepharisma stoltei]
MINWYSLLGARKEELEFQGIEEKSFSDIAYLTNKQEGYSIAVKENQVCYVILFAPGKVPGYPYKLPYGITWSQCNSDIVRRLGEPDKKSSSTNLGIEITYTRFGLSIEFHNADWNDIRNPIKSLIIFEPKRIDAFDYDEQTCFCAQCTKPSQFRCSRCKIFNYCSRDCQRIHWEIHKNTCRKRD